MIDQQQILEPLTHGDWPELFDYIHDDNKNIESLDGSSCDCFSREDVQEVIAIHDGESDYHESWLGLFRLNDGRYVSIVADCCYTGFEACGEVYVTTAKSAELLISHDLTPEQCKLLKLKHPAHSQ